jgi:hypothetical protein
MKPRIAVLVVIVLLVALARLIPHPPNFTPIGAVALFGAAFFRNKWMAFLVPLAALFLSDVALEITTNLGFTSGWLATGRGFHEGMWVVYGTMALIVVLGMLMLRKKMVVTVAGAVLAGSVVFFVLTNFAVWAMTSLYPQTAEGLVDCYVAAIPFFHWTLLGDACFATVLFGGFALAEKGFPALGETTPSSGVEPLATAS